jgi:hypothetical protein
MLITSLGKIAPVTAGTPVQVTADSTIKAYKIIVAQLPTSTGKVYLGRAGLVKGTYAGCIKVFQVPGSTGLLDTFEISGESGEQLTPADYWVDADTSSEGLLVSYQQ